MGKKTMNNKIYRSALCKSAAIGAIAIAATQFGVEIRNSLAQPAYAGQASYGVSIAPEWNPEGQLIRPTGFRSSWVYLGSPITPNGMNEGEASFPEYHNVYVQPSAFHHYRATGTWPEGTMLLKELQLTDGNAEEEDGSRYEVSGRGYFPGVVNGMDLAVKDSSRFADSKNWGYFNFGHHAPPYAKAASAMPTEQCAQCHIDNASEDMVYINMYKGILTPLLEE